MIEVLSFTLFVVGFGISETYLPQVGGVVSVVQCYPGRQHHIHH